MKHVPAVLIGALLMAVLAVGIACGSDDPQPQIGDGPADNLEGDWRGTYIASDGSQNGTLCLSLDQKDRGLTGEVRFNDGEPTSVGGVITESSFLITWGSALDGTPDANAPADITIGGGTLNGTSNAETISGTWISAATADVHGDWTATKLTQFEGCE